MPFNYNGSTEIQLCAPKLSPSYFILYMLTWIAAPFFLVTFLLVQMTKSDEDLRVLDNICMRCVCMMIFPTGKVSFKSGYLITKYCSDIMQGWQKVPKSGRVIANRP